ncbi:hypothetical protein TNCT_468711 [Trichonephila clavata]|uniref:Uncharacterized protein n=1 Tax=Trichonephila clavata TaxID=2740835 RepID=A0A8X6LJL6_TRICU|nr:hypothetical protein TNCT_468711 [Trichonephila clavata]
MKRYDDSVWKKVARLEISKYNISFTLQEEIIALMKPLELAILKWRVVYNGIFTKAEECILEFCFNPDGTVKRVKTADLLIHSKLLDGQRVSC